MKKRFLSLIVLSFWSVFFLLAGEDAPLKIAVISDIHYMDESLVTAGKAMTSYEQSTGRNVNELHLVLDVVWNDLSREKPDLLLITGDIANHGERQSHLAIIRKLGLLQKQGIIIRVIPGNHDVNIPDAKAYRGDKSYPVPSVTKEEFADIYADFGYSDAVERDSSSLSYLSSINDSVWLLGIDACRYDEHATTSVSGGRIRSNTSRWIKDILRDAERKGVIVLGMMHHGLIEHMPYQAAFFPQYLIEEWQQHADSLAEAGLQIVFTGHFHANDITLRATSTGKVIYDIETASLAQYPFAYRIVTMDRTGLSIDTRFVTSIPGAPDLADRYREKLEEMTRRSALTRLSKLGIDMAPETLSALVRLVVNLNLAHVRGDEKLDAEMTQSFEQFAGQFDGVADPNSFSFDFPPADNKVWIPLSTRK